MTDTLFDLPDSPSPRLAWMKRHDIHTELHEHPHKKEQPWNAWVGGYEEALRNAIMHNLTAPRSDNPFFAMGSSEESALYKLAKANHLKLWNEEKL